MAKYLNVEITFPNKETAQVASERILSKRLAASTQINGPIESHYWWQDQRHSAQEWRLSIKTLASSFEIIREEIETHHPYDLPEIIATPIVAAQESYLDWIETYSKGN